MSQNFRDIKPEITGSLTKTRDIVRSSHLLYNKIFSLSNREMLLIYELLDVSKAEYHRTAQNTSHALNEIVSCSYSLCSVEGAMSALNSLPTSSVEAAANVASCISWSIRDRCSSASFRFNATSSD